MHRESARVDCGETVTGTSAGAASEGNQVRPDPARAAAILSDSNPARFSRAEFRLCHLLSTGLGMKAVQAELGISDSTFRTHLRNIHDKTGTRGEAELLRVLLNAPSAAQPSAPARPEPGAQPSPARSRAQEAPTDPAPR